MVTLKELKRLHKDEGGAPELSTVMIVALIVVPLVVAIVIFSQKVFGWWEKTAGGESSDGAFTKKGTVASGKPGVPE